MLRRLSQWRPTHLLLAWCGYWLALLLITIGPGIFAIMRARPEAGEVNASASYGGGVIKLLVAEGSTPTWTLEFGFLTAVLAIGLPPLALWVLWIAAQRYKAPADAERASSSAGVG